MVPIEGGIDALDARVLYRAQVVSTSGGAPILSPTRPSRLVSRVQVDRGDAAAAVAREVTKGWPGVDVQQLPDVWPPVSNPPGVALSLRTFRWLKDRECEASRMREERRRPRDESCVATALFLDWGGLGYFATVSKKQGIALRRTFLAVLMPGPRLWHVTRPGGGWAMASAAGMEAAWMERETAERADAVVTMDKSEGGEGGELLRWAAGEGGWALPTNAFALPFPLPPPPPRDAFTATPPAAESGAKSSASGVAASNATAANSSVSLPLELVYIGPLNTWGGLMLFCDALDALLSSRTDVGDGAEDYIEPPPAFAVRFIGEDGPFTAFGGGRSGKTGLAVLTERAQRWGKAGIRVAFNPDERDVWAAVAYVAAGKGTRLAVLPSSANGLGAVFAALKAVGAPFIVALSPGASQLPAEVTFPPRRRALEAKIREWLLVPRSLSQQWLGDGNDALSAAAAEVDARAEPWRSLIQRGWWVTHGTDVVDHESPGEEAGVETVVPLVSVVVVTRNRASLLRQAIASIANQDHPEDRLEVVLVDDASDDPEHLTYLGELQTGLFKSRTWRVIRLEPPGLYLGGARNAGWRAARGDWILFMDDDNVARRREVRVLLAVAMRTGAEIVTCANDFLEGNDPPRDEVVDDDGDADDTLEHHAIGGQSTGQYVPLGGAAAAGLFRNAFGDANALVSRRALELLGGWAEEDGYGVQDWELFAGAALESNLRLEVVPIPLYWYRKIEGSMARSAATSVFNEELALRPYLSQRCRDGRDDTTARRQACASGTQRALGDVAAYARAMHGEVQSLTQKVATLEASPTGRMLRALVRVQCGSGAPRQPPSSATNHVKNAGFEWTSGDGFLEWFSHGDLGYRRSTDGEGRSERSMGDDRDVGLGVVVRGDTVRGAAGVGGAWQEVVVAQENPEPLVLEGWSRIINRGETRAATAKRTGKSDDPSDYSLYADITFTDGSKRWAFVVPFPGESSTEVTGGGRLDAGTSDGLGWRHEYGIIDEDKPVRSVMLVLLYRHRIGEVMFDDVRLWPLREALCHLPVLLSSA